MKKVRNLLLQAPKKLVKKEIFLLCDWTKINQYTEKTAKITKKAVRYKIMELGLLPPHMSGTKQWRFAITLTNRDVLWCAYDARGTLQGMKVDSKLLGCRRSEDEKKSRVHPAAANGSYSRVASSSQTWSSDEHQLDKNSPCGSENTVIKTSVCRTVSEQLWQIIF